MNIILFVVIRNEISTYFFSLSLCMIDLSMIEWNRLVFHAPNYLSFYILYFFVCIFCISLHCEPWEWMLPWLIWYFSDNIFLKNAFQKNTFQEIPNYQISHDILDITSHLHNITFTLITTQNEKLNFLISGHINKNTSSTKQEIPWEDYH